MTIPKFKTASPSRRRLGLLALVASLGAGAAFAASSPAAAVEIAPTGPGVTIPSTGPASPYPSTITVSDVATVVSVRVTLTELVHTFTADLNIALMAPNGRTVLLLAGCRGGDDVNGTLTFADDGEVLNSGSVRELIGTGTYAPSRCAPPRFDGAAPCPCSQSLATLVGGDANGDWKLWVFDDLDGDAGSMAGWTLELTTNAAPVAGDGSFTGPRDVALRDSLAGLTGDADDDELVFAAASEPAHGSLFVNSSGTFNYAPDDGFVGLDTFAYHVDDGRLSDEGEVTITITDDGGTVPRGTCDGRPATIVGTPGSDVLTGTPGADVIVAGGGRDWIAGGDGRDTICAGAGADTVRGGPGGDTISGGGARDLVQGGLGNDTLTGRTGRDMLIGGAGNDTLRGAAGQDTLLGLSGNDHIGGGSNTDSCHGGTGTDRATACERTLGIP